MSFYIIGIAIWGQKAIQKVHFISRLWARFIFFWCGIWLKTTGQAPNPKQPMVLISNHLSALDIPVCAIATRNPFKFLAKAELGKIPVLGWIISNIYITVNRSSPAARKQSLAAMKKAIDDGTSVFIYPEGTRNTSSDPLRRFHEGAFKLAIDAQVPVGILHIQGTNRICPPKGFSLNPGRLKAHWVAIKPTTGLKPEDSEKLMEQCQEELLNSIKEMQ
ncbi:MAG: 1-acyl-sn-glycerol-3-phosphate acyltransferase [Bacteroidetes bacterium]|nr:1-acyl-sn-glycerol-3-phosphate acyltransferase [Bacteroidota bacterium]